MDLEEKKKQVDRIGVIVLIILGILTIAEYMIGKFVVGWWQILLLISLIKAFFVIRDYMHIGRVFTGSEEVDE